MEDKKLSFEVHAQGTLKKAVETPVGVLYIDTEHDLLYIESEHANAFEKMYSLTCIAVLGEVEGAEAIKAMMRTFGQLKKDQVTKNGEDYDFNVSISGELEEAVENKYGSVYVSQEHHAWYFEPKHPNTFLEGIEFKKFLENIERDVLNPKLAMNAISMMLLMKDWTKLDNDDIVK